MLKNGTKTTIHKAIITIFIIILLMCPAPTGKLRQYTTSILGKITYRCYYSSYML